MQVLKRDTCAESSHDSPGLCTVGPSFNLDQKPCALYDGSILAYFTNSTWIQIGISSIPSWCNSENKGIFTRVDPYINWISAITGLTP